MEFYDLCVNRGATLHRVMRLKKNGDYVDLTGYSAKSEVRVNPDGGELICVIQTTVDAEEDRIVLLVPDDVTAGIETGNYAWDIKLTDPDGIVTYYVGGKFVVLPSVTE